MQDWRAIISPTQCQAVTNGRDGAYEHAEHGAEAFIVHTDQIYYLALLYTDENWHSYGNGYAQFADGQKMSFNLDGNNDPKVREKCIQASRQIARAFAGTLHRGIVDSSGRFWPDDEEQTPQKLM
ncbi:MAG: hypothetical protein U5L00_16160 [Desulfovermiculus sp.]|nr:hypothetical protein [Desulfovermiculus sp.]